MSVEQTELFLSNNVVSSNEQTPPQATVVHYATFSTINLVYTCSSVSLYLSAFDEQSQIYEHNIEVERSFVRCACALSFFLVQQEVFQCRL